MKRRLTAILVLTTGLAMAQPPLTPAQLKSAAEHYARAGQAREAAALYEQVLQADTTARSMLAPLLVRLYIESKQPRPALAWALIVMTNTPDPEAYLAGVYQAIGSHHEAHALLTLELSRSNSPERAKSLRMQLDQLLTPPDSQHSTMHTGDN